MLPRAPLGEEELERMRATEKAAGSYFAENAAPRCAICMEDFVAGDDTVRLPCTHLYHYECASRWLQRKCVCPLDQTPVALPEDEV